MNKNKGFTPLEIRECRGKPKQNKFLTGFTIIELLVVIAIIAVLASIVLVNVNQFRAKARDAVRKQDLSQIQKALEMYFIEYGGYPSSACPSISFIIKDSLALEPKMANFLPAFPQDPFKGSCYNNNYLYISNQYNNCGAGNNALATKYVLYATLEDQSFNNLSDTGVDAWLRGGQALAVPQGRITDWENIINL